MNLGILLYFNQKIDKLNDISNYTTSIRVGNETKIYYAFLIYVTIIEEYATQ
jgi:hypothetical protein